MCIPVTLHLLAQSSQPSMFTRTLVVVTLVAAALAAPAPQVDIPVTVSAPILSGNTGGNSYVAHLALNANQKASSDRCFRNTVLPIASGLPIIGGLRRRQLGDLPIGGIVGAIGTAEGTVEGLLGSLPPTGLPIGSIIGLIGTVDGGVEGVIGDVNGILNGPLWYVPATVFPRCRSCLLTLLAA